MVVRSPRASQTAPVAGWDEAVAASSLSRKLLECVQACDRSTDQAMNVVTGVKRRTIRRVAAGWSILWCASVPATSLADPLAYELTPFAAAVTGGEFEEEASGSNVDVGSSSGFGVTFDIGADGYDRQYQLYYSRQATQLEAQPAFDLDVEYLHLGGILAFPQDHVTPYIVGTLGVTRFSPVRAATMTRRSSQWPWAAGSRCLWGRISRCASRAAVS